MSNPIKAAENAGMSAAQRVVLSLIAAICAAFLAQFLSSGIVLVLGQFNSEFLTNTQYKLPAAAISMASSLVVTSLIANSIMKKAFGLSIPTFSNFRITRASISEGILAGAGAFLLLQFVAVASAYLLGHQVIHSSDTSNTILSLNGASFAIVSLVMVPFISPVAEEMMFRGLILGSVKTALNTRFGRILAVLISATLFGVFHISSYTGPESLIPAINSFVFGLITGYLVLKHNSLVPSMVCHMSYNGLTVAISYLLQS